MPNREYGARMKNMDKNQGSKRGPLSRAGALGNWVAGTLRAQTLVRMLGIPFQRFFDQKGGTHKFLTEKAVEILRADGLTDAATFFAGWLDTVVRGNYWADTLWMNATHHYNPKTKRGLWIWPPATEQIKHWWNQSISHWKKGNDDKAMFFLGACLHIVQDLCQPFHSNGAVFGGHQNYEKWADEHKEDYAVGDGGIYGIALNPAAWAVANAEASVGYLNDVASGDDTRRDAATRILLPRAMRTSAGFLDFFCTATSALEYPKDRRIAAGS